MKRAVRWIGAAILAAAVLTMVLADIVLAADAAQLKLLEKGPAYGLVATQSGDYAPQVIGEAAPILLVPAAGDAAGRRAAIGFLGQFCAGRGLTAAPAEAWDDEYIHFDAVAGEYQFPNPCGLGL